MASLFKPKFKRWRDPDGRPCKKNTLGATSSVYEAKKWYGRYFDKYGIQRTTPLAKDKSAAQQMLADKIKEVERRKAGLIDNFTDHASEPIKVHLEAYRAYLKSTGGTADHVKDTLNYCYMVCEYRLPETKRSKRQRGQQRRSSRAKCEKYKLIQALPQMTADRVVAYLNDLIKLGRSARTFNAYLQAMQQFCAWCVVHGRRPDNPIAHLKKRSTKEDRRRVRRDLSLDDVSRIIQAAEQSPIVFRRLASTDRAMLYKTAYASGLRCSKLRSLTTASLMLGDAAPIIVLEAAHSKSGNRDEQLIPMWLADDLQTWLRNKPAPAVVSGRLRELWPGSWDGRAAEMLREDLKAAGVPYVDEAGEYFDFHAIRHDYLTGFSERDVSPKKAQQLARHSDINLTMNTYTHLKSHDLVETVEAIPNPFEVVAQQRQRATGTDGKADPGRTAVALLVAHTESEKSSDKNAQQQRRKEVIENRSLTCCALGENSVSDHQPSMEEQKKPLHSQGLHIAEGRGFEPPTAFAAPDFESGCWPIRLPSPSITNLYVSCRAGKLNRYAALSG